MSDSLSNFILQYSSSGPNGPWTNTGSSPLAPSTRECSDSTPVNPVIWYKLNQTTVSGVSVPYPIVSISGLPMGHLTGVVDPDDPTTLIFTWDVPDGLPAPIEWFELSGKFLNDPEEYRLFLDAFGGGERTGRAPVIPTNDFNNPYTYSLVGFIPR